MRISALGSGTYVRAVRTLSPVKYVQVVVAPSGQRYFVVAAPPGSAIAGDLFPLQLRDAGLVIGAFRFFANLIRGRWNLAVEEIDERGRAHGGVHKETADDEAAAERRIDAIVAAIQAGSWQR